jgi:hypothetical protein
MLEYACIAKGCFQLHAHGYNASQRPTPYKGGPYRTSLSLYSQAVECSALTVCERTAGLHYPSIQGIACYLSHLASVYRQHYPAIRHPLCTHPRPPGCQGSRIACASWIYLWENQAFNSPILLVTDQINWPISKLPDLTSQDKCQLSPTLVVLNHALYLRSSRGRLRLMSSGEWGLTTPYVHF